MKNRIQDLYEKVKAVRAEDYVGHDSSKHERMVQEGFVAKAKRYLRYLPMATEVVAMYFCMLDAKTPLWVKTTVAAALAYFILPIDAIPDMLPIVGLSDDASVLAAAIAAISSHITAEHYQKAGDWLQTEQIHPAEPPKTGEAAS